MPEVTTETTETGVITEGFAPPPIDSKYRLILLAAQRTKQLQRGALPRVKMDPRKHKATRIALQELLEGKVNFRILDN
ncbi:MAG: DNA-directed RNA polymerase subunit omega [Blastocatellia bacterium]|mgnify:CR=1 FL=1